MCKKKKDVQTRSTSVVSKSSSFAKKEKPQTTSFVENKPALEQVEEEGETCDDNANLLDLDFEMFSDTTSTDDENPEKDKRPSLFYTMTINWKN